MLKGWATPRWRSIIEEWILENSLPSLVHLSANRPSLGFVSYTMSITRSTWAIVSNVPACLKGKKPFRNTLCVRSTLRDICIPVDSLSPQRKLSYDKWSWDQFFHCSVFRETNSEQTRMTVVLLHLDWISWETWFGTIECRKELRSELIGLV